MRKYLLKWIWQITMTAGILGLLALILPRLITALYAMNRIHSVEDAPEERVAIIFGAGLRRDGSPTAILQDRVETGAKLYFEWQSGKVIDEWR